MMLMQLKQLKKAVAQAGQAGWGTEMLSDDVASHDAAAAAAGSLGHTHTSIKALLRLC